MRGMSKNSTRRRRRGARLEALEHVGADALARRDPDRGESRMARGSRQLGQRGGHVAADDEGQLVLRTSVMEPAEGIDRVRAPRDVHLDARDAEPLVAGHGGRQSATRCSAPGIAVDLLVRRRVDRQQQHAVEPELRRSASCAQTRWPTWGGLNVPPSSPTRSTAQGRIWPSPSTRYLNVHSSRSADRPAGVQLLGRVADLGAHPELAAVGEARRGVDVDAGGVDAELEGARGARVAGQDRLGVARAVGLTCSIASSAEPTTLTARTSARNSSAQSASLGRRADGAGDRARARSSPRSSTPGRAQRAEHARAGTPPRRPRARAASRRRCRRRGAGSWR